MWEEIVLPMGQFGVAVGSLTFLARSLVGHFLSGDLERHRLKLQAQNDAAIERLRSDLRTAGLEHEIRFRNVHEKVAEVVGKSYEMLEEAYAAIAAYVLVSGGMSDDGVEPKRIEAMLERFSRFYFPRRIYLPKDTSDRVVEFFRTLQQTFTLFSARVGTEQPTACAQAHAELETRAKPLFDELHRRFQDLLGTPGASPTDRGPRGETTRSGPG